ncbi:hypothetical protein AAVH_00266 [Aphelenchoides avenae]|nr:hypothetical protein AAVH_00266 [Aphelenchus avenae]
MKVSTKDDDAAEEGTTTTTTKKKGRGAEMLNMMDETARPASKKTVRNRSGSAKGGRSGSVKKQ